MGGMLHEKMKYSKIPLMQLAWGWADTRLSDILDYWAVPTLT
jgi:hypothetical protein